MAQSWAVARPPQHNGIQDEKNAKESMATPTSRQYFSASVASDTARDFNARAAECISVMAERVGLPLGSIPAEVEREFERTFPRIAFDAIAALGVPLEGAIVVDLGSGLGSAAVEASQRGAIPIAVEPGSGWRELASDRIHAVGEGGLVAAVGEALPFRNDSVDIVVSLMVLEHVTNPQRVLEEVFRILKPGGVFFLACENYLCFREPHYRVAWLPLMPKRLGAAYLRLRGRPTEFLYDSITYVTRPGVVRMLEDCGFSFQSARRLQEVVQSPDQLATPWKRQVLSTGKRLLSDQQLLKVARAFATARDLCRGPICEILRKPN